MVIVIISVAIGNIKLCNNYPQYFKHLNKKGSFLTHAVLPFSEELYSSELFIDPGWQSNHRLGTWWLMYQRRELWSVLSQHLSIPAHKNAHHFAPNAFSRSKTLDPIKSQVNKEWERTTLLLSVDNINAQHYFIIINFINSSSNIFQDTNGLLIKV